MATIGKRLPVGDRCAYGGPPTQAMREEAEQRRRRRRRDGAGMPTDHPDTAPSDLAPAARGSAIRSAEVLVTSPDRNFVTLRITTRGRGRRPRRRHAERPRAVGGVVPVRPRGAAAARAGRAPHRGHLAVPLPLGVLAARPGDHGRHRRGRRGPVGHQGQGRRDAAVPAARRGQPDRDHGVRARERPGPARAVRLDPAPPGAGLPLHPRADRRSRASTPSTGWPRSRRRRAATTTSPPSAPPCRPRRTGTPAPTCGTCPACSRPSATSSVPSCRCCTTGTTG